jgi:methylenetetrahydrofolate dehydrogenase (NADP+)/methenyltetrahydrofolate cyclohydrolase
MMRFADTISEDKLMKHIDQVNRDEDVDGFIVQLTFTTKHFCRTDY